LYNTAPLSLKQFSEHKEKIPSPLDQNKIITEKLREECERLSTQNKQIYSLDFVLKSSTGTKGERKYLINAKWWQ